MKRHATVSKMQGSRAALPQPAICPWRDDSTANCKQLHTLVQYARHGAKYLPALSHSGLRKPLKGRRLSPMLYKMKPGLRGETPA